MLLKRPKNLKVVAILMFFALCIPSVAYGTCITITGELNPDAEAVTEPAETETNEPGIVEPTAEEPTAEEPTAEEPTAEEPTAEEPTAEEPTAEEPTAEEPTAEEPTAEEPAAEEPTVEEPTAEEPTAEEPAAEEPTVEEPTVEEPLPIRITDQIILTSVEGLPSEAIVEFTLNGTRIGLVFNGTITDAAPILAADREQIKASVLNKVRIVGAKIKFDTYQEPTEQPFIEEFVGQELEPEEIIEQPAETEKYATEPDTENLVD